MVNWKRAGRINVKVVVILFLVVVAIGASLFVARHVRRRILSRMDYNAGLAAYEKGDWPTACKHFQEYIGRNPHDLGILKKYAEAKMHTHPLDGRAVGEAISAYRRIIRLDPNDISVYDRLADIYTYTGQFDELRYIAQRIKDQNLPDDWRSPLWKEKALFRQNKMDDPNRVALGEFIVNELDPVKHPKEYVDACTLMCRIIISDDSIDSVDSVKVKDRDGNVLDLRPIDFLNRAVQNDPNSAEALAARARFYRMNPNISDLDAEKRKAAACADLEAADKLDTQDLKVLSTLCAEWIAWDELDNAQKEFQKAGKPSKEVINKYFLDIDDWRIRKFRLTWELAMRKGDPNEAATKADEVLDELTEKRKRLQVLDPAIISYIYAGRPVDANSCLDEYIDATRGAGLNTQKRLRLAYLRALVARAQNRPYDVIDILRPVLTGSVSDPKLRPLLTDAYFLLANAYVGTNQTSRAADALKSYLSLNPKDTQATLRLAEQYLKLGDWSKVFEYTKQVESLDPNNIGNRLNRIEAEVNLAGERKDKARLTKLSTELAELRQKHPERNEIHTLEAMIALNMGKREDAEKDLKTAISQSEGPLKLRAEMQLAKYYYGQKRIADAISECEDICKRDPNVAEPWQLLANYQIANGDPNSARATLDRGLAVDDVGEGVKRTLTIQLAKLELQQGGHSQDKGIELLTKLAKQNKEDIETRVLLLSIPDVLNDPSKVLGDPNGVQKLVNDMKATEGESGFQWRYYQALLWSLSKDWRLNQSKIIDHLRYCIDAEPNWLKPVLQLGVLYERLNDYQSAEDVYRRALAKNPAAIEIADRLTNLLLLQKKLSDPNEVLNLVKASSDATNDLELKTAIGSGDLDLAIRNLKERLSKDSKNANAQIYLARLVYSKNKDFEEANKYLKAAEDIDPNSVDLISTKVAILKKDGQSEAAMKVLDDYVRKTNSFNAYLLRAVFLVGEGNFDAAKKDYQKMRTFTDQGALGYGYVLLSNAYMVNKDPNESVKTLKDGSNAYPEDLRLERALMKTLFQRDNKGDKEEALRILRKLEGKFPQDIELMRIRSKLLLAESTPESIKEAKKILEHVVELDPRVFDAYIKLVDIAIDSNDLRRARDLVIQGLAYNPKNATLLSMRSGDVDTIVTLAGLYLKGGDMEKAKKRIEQAEQLDPNSPSVINAYISLALTFYQKGDAERAKQIYQKLLNQYSNIYPENIGIFNDLAWILQEHDSDYDTALDLADKGLNAVRKDTEKLHLLDTKGTILFKMGRFAYAKKNFENLLSLSPPDSSRMAKALLQLARTCNKLKESDQVKEHLNKALEINQKLSVFTPEEKSEIDQLLK